MSRFTKFEKITLKELEDMAHPKCGIESFDGYEPLVKRIDKLEVVVGTLKKNDWFR